MAVTLKQIGKRLIESGTILITKDGYCCYSDGKMIHDCELYGYIFDSNGVATKLS